MTDDKNEIMLGLQRDYRGGSEREKWCQKECDRNIGIFSRKRSIRKHRYKQVKRGITEKLVLIHLASLLLHSGSSKPDSQSSFAVPATACDRQRPLQGQSQSASQILSQM